MPRIDFAFCLHSHQPAGNLEFVVENAYEKAYRPFLEVVRRHPEVRVVLHYSGALLTWFESHRPETLEIIRKLVSEGRAELMTGGFYEPILPIIPDRDKLGQIGALTSYLEPRFGTHPKGLWLTERVWEPDLVSPLVRAGVCYTIADDNNFQLAGISEQQGLGHFSVNGSEGEGLQVFPINGSLRRAIPFQPPEAVIELLAHLGRLPAGWQAGNGNRLALFADDGEKLGEWPGTHQLVYSEGWLERFFRLLADNRDWIHMTTLAQHLEQVPALGRVALPAGSYPEMMEWSGGSWRNFLARYPESNLMYRKMLQVSDAVAKMTDPPDQVARARDYLYRGQSNCPYWHGVFGGLYLLHLRTDNYRSLLTAEKLANPGQRLQVEQVDFDGDGQEETLVSSPRLNCYLHRTGGQIFELDHRALAWNLLATLARQRERYHEQSGDGDYDWYLRRALIDHFLRDGTNVEDFARCRYGEQGDFVNQPYEFVGQVRDLPRPSDREREAVITLRRQGGVWVGQEFPPVAITKRLAFSPDSPTVGLEYQIEWLGGAASPAQGAQGQSASESLPLWFACESTFVLSSSDPQGRYYQVNGSSSRLPLSSRGSHSGVREIAFMDEWLGGGVRLRFAQPTEVWAFPVETVSQGLEGPRRSYQGSCVAAHWRLNLRRGQPWGTSFSIMLL